MNNDTKQSSNPADDGDGDVRIPLNPNIKNMELYDVRKKNLKTFILGYLIILFINARNTNKNL